MGVVGGRLVGGNVKVRLPRQSARRSVNRRQYPGSPTVSPCTTENRCKHCCSLAMSASLARVVSNRTDSTPPPATFGVTRSGRVPGTCEHAAVTCLAAARLVLGASCTVIHCLLSAEFILAHPPSKPVPSAPTASAQAAIRTPAPDTAQA